MFCCIYLTICDRQVLLKYFIDKYYWDILTGSYLCFYFYPIFGKERPHMILRNMSKSVLTVDCFCHPLVMLHRWLEKSRSVFLGHFWKRKRLRVTAASEKCTVAKKQPKKSPKCRRCEIPNLHIYNGPRIRVNPERFQGRHDSTLQDIYQDSCLTFIHQILYQTLYNYNIQKRKCSKGVVLSTYFI